jgi:predicted  nucleic acid-binding Zn-ribbon protein
MENANLNLCNLVGRGMTLKEAREHLEGVKPKPVEPPKDTTKNTTKKPTAKERKEALSVEIEKYGGEAPHMNSSIAKFEEALTAAKTAKADKEQTEADAAQEVADAAQEAADEAGTDEAQEVADAAQEVADEEQDESQEAAEDLM